MCAWFSHASFALAKGAPPHFCVALGAVGLPGLVWCVVCDPAACHVANVTRAERLEQMLARACSNSFRKSFLGLGFGVPFGVAGCRGVREGLWGSHDCIYIYVCWLWRNALAVHTVALVQVRAWEWIAAIVSVCVARALVRARGASTPGLPPDSPRASGAGLEDADG